MSTLIQIGVAVMRDNLSTDKCHNTPLYIKTNQTNTDTALLDSISRAIAQSVAEVKQCQDTIK